MSRRQRTSRSSRSARPQRPYGRLSEEQLDLLQATVRDQLRQARSMRRMNARVTAGKYYNSVFWTLHRNVRERMASQKDASVGQDHLRAIADAAAPHMDTINADSRFIAELEQHRRELRAEFAHRMNTAVGSDRRQAHNARRILARQSGSHAQPVASATAPASSSPSAVAQLTAGLKKINFVLKRNK